MSTTVKCSACGAVISVPGKNCQYCGAALFNLEQKSQETSPTGSLEEKVLELCKAGNFLEAIKIYKDATGKGLKESKDAVEALAQKNGIEKPKGCFIATACYGDFNASEVIVLRQFRDNYLLNRGWGKSFVKFYYAFSPPAARVLERSFFLKKIVRVIFLSPLVKAVQKGGNK